MITDANSVCYTLHFATKRSTSSIDISIKHCMSNVRTRYWMLAKNLKHESTSKPCSLVCRKRGAIRKRRRERCKSIHILSKVVHDDFVQKVRDAVNDDIIAHIMERMSAVVRKREKTLTTEEYWSLMHNKNMLQRDLVLEVFHRIFIIWQTQTAANLLHRTSRLW